MTHSWALGSLAFCDKWYTWQAISYLHISSFSLSLSNTRIYSLKTTLFPGK